MPAPIALLHVLHVAAERVAPWCEELFFVGAEDIGHFEPMFSHRPGGMADQIK